MNKKGFTLVNALVSMIIFAAIVLIISTGLLKSNVFYKDNYKNYTKKVDMLNVENAINKDLNSNYVPLVSWSEHNPQKWFKINESLYIIKNDSLYRNDLELTPHSKVVLDMGLNISNEKKPYDLKTIKIKLIDKDDGSEELLIINETDFLFNTKTLHKEAKQND